MNEIIYSQIFLLTLTVGVYLGAVQLRRRVNCALLHPILVSVAVLIAFVKLTGMPYEHYMRQTSTSCSACRSSHSATCCTIRSTTFGATCSRSSSRSSRAAPSAS